ncbi:hypothetical protein B9Z55_017806 [Caenorhabditis nigoni]|uniref:CYtochrome P450 family n=1 Tax=Caenorhabditis nigoni TaxID=1611254 RepID=A0A2G5TBB5_9PELO|nr:hypothetical protein B9Z55_017806 [Caenorhabditis nigoni]
MISKGMDVYKEIFQAIFSKSKMLLILILIAILIYSVISLWRATKLLPKGPTPLPLIGNFHTVGYYAWKTGGIVAGLREIQRIYGKVFTLWMGPMPTVHIADFDVAHETHIKRANTFALREEGDDFVDAFLIKMDKDKKDGVKDSTFTLENLAIDLYDLWLAGQDTTSTTLTWACACLLNHPEVVEELRRELVDVTGGTRGVSLTDKPNTPYLNATVNESQRIASVLNTNIFRQLEEDTVIDGQPVSAGALVTTQLSLLHTDEAVFKNHKVFNPSRFLKNKNLEKIFIPFGIGKRSCLGESLARAELYLIIGNLVLDFNFEPVGTKPEIKTTTPFTPMKRPPNYDIKFVPVNN